MRKLMKKSYEFLIQSKREDIDFINKIVDAYEGAGSVRKCCPKCFLGCTGDFWGIWLFSTLNFDNGNPFVYTIKIII